MNRSLTLLLATILTATILVAIGYKAVTILAKRTSPEPSQTQSASNGPMNLIQVEPADDTSQWRIYRNERYGFELRYPTNVELLDDRTLIYSPRLTAEFTLCLAPITRRESSCEVELYVTSQVESFTKVEDHFLDSAHKVVTRARNYQPTIGQHKAQEFDVTTSEGGYIRNSFLQRNQYVYLFVLPNLSSKQQLSQYYAILASVRFIGD